MILLIGGTSETAPLALAIAEAGFKVLVSTATDVPLDVGKHPNVTHRTGALDQSGMRGLVTERGIGLIVDASHPYAAAAAANARATALHLEIPYLRWLRPSVLEENEHLIVRDNHELAAETACSFGVPVLLTTGSRNLAPYVAAAERAGIALVVRVLPHPGSIDACRRARVRDDHIVAGRGPFSVEDNLAVMRRHKIGVLVTKDSGVAGGVPAKIEAAAIHGCRVVVVSRPNDPNDATFSNIQELVTAVSEALGV